MQFKPTLLTLFLTSASARALLPRADAQWTLNALSRACDAADTSCTWKFGINTNTAGVNATACTLVVKGTTAVPKASEANGGPSQCGAFQITSGWSGQFGPGEGFTVISVVETATQKIIYGGYKDTQVQDGKVVDPDLSFTVQQVP
ncbi:surface protein 1 [Nemania sp. FL0916]|nr:surface protein 1 [Nemania sp. FL0916]